MKTQHANILGTYVRSKFRVDLQEKLEVHLRISLGEIIRDPIEENLSYCNTFFLKKAIKEGTHET